MKRQRQSEDGAGPDAGAKRARTSAASAPDETLELMDLGDKSATTHNAVKGVRFAVPGETPAPSTAPVPSAPGVPPVISSTGEVVEEGDEVDALHFLPHDTVAKFKKDYEKRRARGEDEQDERITPFHMGQEMKRGHFDPETGSYVDWKQRGGDQDSDSDDEPWLEDYIKGKGGKRQAVGMDKVLDVFSEHTGGKGARSTSADPRAGEGEDLPTLLRRITALLREGETVQRAMKRLRGKKAQGGQRARACTKKAKKARGGAMDAEEEAAEEKAGQAEKDKEEKNKEEEEKEKKEAADKRAFDALVELVDNCLTHNYSSVYEDTREVMLKRIGESLERENAGSSSSATSASSSASDGAASAEDATMWEYKVSEADTNIFGPFTTAQMVDWSKQGYFASNAGVQARIVGRERFNPAARIEFEDYLDE